MLGFTLLLSVGTGLLCGTAPAWIASRTHPVESLRGAQGQVRDAIALPQRILVVLQAALSLVLLTTAALLLTSLRALEHQNFRFHPEGTEIVFTDLKAGGYAAAQLPQLYRRFDDAFARMPGVTSFAYATYGPMAHDNWDGGVFFTGQSTTEKNVTFYDAVSPAYFATLGTSVIAGREFTEDDTAAAPNVAVINHAFADKYFRDKNPVGLHFGPAPQKAAEFEVVGVVEDTKYVNPAEPAAAMYFTPITQSVAWSTDRDMQGEASKHFAENLIVRFHGDASPVAAQVRQALNGINPEIPIISIERYTDELSSNFTQQDLIVRLTALFGALALLLASIGLYGVTAYAVARRTGEIGIRMALGAGRAGVLAMILRAALTQALLGLALGLPLTFLAGQLLRHTLYQTSSFQPLVLLAVAALLLASAFAAALIPARRAASIDPMTALRSE